MPTYIDCCGDPLIPIINTLNPEGRLDDLQSLYVFLAGCCRVFDLPLVWSHFIRLPNHMPRLDCPSVSAETRNRTPRKTLNQKSLLNFKHGRIYLYLYIYIDTLLFLLFRAKSQVDSALLACKNLTL